jgi:hypothetical protein
MMAHTEAQRLQRKTQCFYFLRPPRLRVQPIKRVGRTELTELQNSKSADASDLNLLIQSKPLPSESAYIRSHPRLNSCRKPLCFLCYLLLNRLFSLRSLRSLRPSHPATSWVANVAAADLADDARPSRGPPGIIQICEYGVGTRIQGVFLETVSA